jgi:hypothetical protein
LRVWVAFPFAQQPNWAAGLQDADAKPADHD